MRRIESVNDFVIKFANVNGTGSASAQKVCFEGSSRDIFLEVQNETCSYI